MDHLLPWARAAHLPWHHFLSPFEQWQLLPSFVVGETVFLLAALLAFVHARRNGRGHLMLWLAALLAGTANDLIFMALPLVDNFWQAQAMVMLTPRLPLYIPCVYVCFLYFPTIAARRAGLPPLATAALAGLLGILFYAPYDITGAKFLWWTWHDTDQPIAARLLGAPMSSSLWVITFVASFAWLAGRAVPVASTATSAGDGPRGAAFAKGLALVAGLTTALMLVQITVIQQVDGGTPAGLSLLTAFAVYGALAASGLRGNRSARGSHEPDPLARGVVAMHFLTFVVVMALFSPGTHRSPGVHQAPGPCYVEATDITGLVRHEYLCTGDFDEDFTFDCSAPPADGAEWYTVCGKPHTNFPAWMLGVSLLAAGGLLAFGRLFGARPASAPSASSVG